MAQASEKFRAGPLTFTVRHELWDGNIQDHADQGVSIAVMAEGDVSQVIPDLRTFESAMASIMVLRKPLTRRNALRTRMRSRFICVLANR